MTNDEMALKLLDYLDGALSAAEREAFEAQIAQDAELRKMLEEMQVLRNTLPGLVMEQPSANLAGRFHNFLQQEKRHDTGTPAAKNGLQKFLQDWRFAAASVLLLLGFGLGLLWTNNLRQQSQIVSLQEEMRTTQRLMVLATLEKPSASDRIRAVNVLQKTTADPEIINALIKTMNFDDMTNVRMKATQALAKFGSDPVVKEALIQSLPQQESPEVQIAIIDALVAIGEKRAVPALQEVSRNKDRLDIVRQKAASGVQKLI